MDSFQTQVLVIGGGITGAGIARDLSLRGVNCIIAERYDINAGASGANHGLLHSGARYVSNDATAAEECRREGELLKKLAGDCIEDTGGLFVAIQGDDEKFVADFPHLCAQSGIDAQAVSIEEARELEPVLSDRLVAAYKVPDASVDPFKLTLDNFYQARSLGSTLLRHSEVTGFEIDVQRIVRTKLKNLLTGEDFFIEAELVVNASGAWAKEIAALAGCSVNLLYSKGSLLVTHNRVTRKVINRLRPSSNADILVPGGTVSILGTTSVRIDTLDAIFPTVKEIDFILEEGASMIPALEKTRYIRAYSGVRPLLGSQSTGDDRNVSRGFALLDHAENDLDNFVTITGGKLTTYRLMAEKVADLVCGRMGISAPCLTRTEALPSGAGAKWTKPGLAPKMWVKHHDPDDTLLCECEMVPKSVVDSLIDSIHLQNGKPDLKALGVRSRIGKGACQGTFCALRTGAYLYDAGEMENDEGLDSIRAFISERWRGIRPLLWDTPLIQAELQEAIYCGMFGLEIHDRQ
ncbi:MAG: anaerobic glycerol-3-phosphate dehydrogenase subunit A [Deltaproteobacteria bacterium]|nr:anaerobic glycerol-3-phosphate dehydrogenase subunit A [Deltaproteobacteria bacterium]